jgi:S1-C subfamily serine protease
MFVLEPDLSVPFTAILASSRETEELREQLKNVRSDLTETRRNVLTRERELRASLHGAAEEALRQDEQMQQLKAREGALEEEVNRLNDRLEAVSESVMRRQLAEIQSQQERSFAAAVQAQEESRRHSQFETERARTERERALQEEYELRRPLNYIIAGQSFVAGAQLQSLNPDLATYFNVEEGVLVTEVLEGTPAAEAGLTSGDVIVQVGGEPVASLEDLRFGIGYFERPLRLRVIRKGEPVSIVIR